MCYSPGPVQCSSLLYTTVLQALSLLYNVATAVFLLDLGFFRFMWGSGLLFEILCLFDFGQVLEFSLKNTVVS